MIRTTLGYLLCAGVGLTGALNMRPQPPEPVHFEDTGELLFSRFEDASQATSLEVQAWDERRSSLSTFAVAYQDGAWVIPSHNDYPADAVDRMGAAAASFLGARKDIFVTDADGEHAALGVLDPDATEGKQDERGTRFVLKDASDSVLVDAIVGKAVPGKAGYRYVRFPDSSRVYASKIELDVSTKFSDWIDHDLLRISSDEIMLLTSNAYRVDEATGRVDGHDPLRFERRTLQGESEPRWVQVASGPDMNLPFGERPLVDAPRGQTLDESMVHQLVTALDRLEIVGVRRQPAQLTQRALETHGFFLSKDLQHLFGNEGELSAVTEDGVVLTLYFGELSHESGLALTAGDAASGEAGVSGDEKANSGEAGNDAPSETGAHRYMFVSVAYDPSFAQGDELPTLEDEVGAVTVTDPDAGTDAEAKTGRARADRLRKRFERWFYVVSDKSFEQLHKQREDFYVTKAKD